jgi:hypothetical protein
MASSAQLPERARARWSLGLLNLAGLLAVIAACAVLFTVYLLRLDQSDRHTAPPPSPYRVLLERGTELWSMGPGGMARSAQLPSGASSQPTLRLSPDGSKLLIIDSNASGDRLWLLTAPGTAPTQLSLPPKALESGPWRGRDHLDGPE